MVVVGTDVHKRTHTFVAVVEVGRKLGEKVVAATSAGHHKALVWARGEFGDDLLWGIEDCRNLSARLERDLLSAGQKVVRVAPKRWPNRGPRRVLAASPIPLMPWRSLKRCCATPICRSPRMTRFRVSSSCWWTAVKTLSRNGLRRSTGYVNVSMSSIPLPSRRWPRCTARNPARCWAPGWTPSQVCWPSWPATNSPT